MSLNLSDKKCIPCEAGTPPLSVEQAAEYMTALKDGWDLHEGKLRRWFNFPDFKATIKFLNDIAKLAEEEGHHPDLHVSYNKLLVELWTHAIHGLSENDFIIAAKIDTL